MMTSLKQSWPVLLFCGLVAFTSMALVYGIGAIFTEVMDTFRVSRATASLTQSLCIGLLFMSGIFTGHFLQRFGPRVTVITGSVLATAGCVIAFLATHIVYVIVGIGVLGGIGMSLNVLTSITVTGTVFHDVKSLALSTNSLCIAVGSSVFPIVLTYLTKEYSLRGTFLILAAINCQVILCGALIGLFIPRTPRKTVEISEPSEEDEAADEADVAAHVADNHGNPTVADNHGNPTHVADNRGNPTKSGDGAERCRSCAEVQRNEESTSLLDDVAKDQSVVVDDGALPYRVTVTPGDGKKDNHSKVLYHHQLEARLDQQSDDHIEPKIHGRNLSEDDSRLLCNNCINRNNESIQTSPLKEHEKRRFCYFGKCLMISCFDRHILGNTRFVAFAMLGASCALYIYQPIMFMTDMVRASQLTAEDGSFFLTIIFVGNVLGRGMAGLLYKLLQSRVLYVYSVSIAMGGVLCLFLLLTHEYSHFVVVSFLLGLNYGVMSATFQMAHLEILGPERYTVGLGYACTVEGIFALLSGPYAGLIRDLANSYKPLYYVAGVHGLVAGSLLVFTVLRCRPRS